MLDNQISVQLSKRELEILQMVATGASNKQIARQLVISENTVKVHLRNIYEKMGVQSRTEATLYAIQKGLVNVAEGETEPAVAPSRRTFLAVNPRPPLHRWQQIYLLAALALAVGVVALPLIPRPAAFEAPLLPVIYAQPPTPAPAAPAANRWTAQTQMPTRRAGLGLTAYQGRLYAIGGVRDNNQATRAVEIFDPLTNGWSEGAAKPTATANVSAIELNDKIYVPGGCTSDGQAVKSLEIYNPQTDTWSKGQSLPEGRCGYGLAAYKGQLYLFGGWDGQKFVDTILVYSPEKQQWHTLELVLPRPLGYMGVTALNEAIYLVGGYDGQAEFNQTYLFELPAGRWQKKAPLTEKRGGLGLVQVENSLYAVGGGWDHPLTTSEKYDPAADAWTSFETPLAEPWRNLGLAAIDTKLYAVGGWNGGEQKFLDSVMSYQFLYQLFLPISNTEK